MTSEQRQMYKTSMSPKIRVEFFVECSFGKFGPFDEEFEAHVETATHALEAVDRGLEDERPRVVSSTGVVKELEPFGALLSVASIEQPVSKDNRIRRERENVAKMASLAAQAFGAHDEDVNYRDPTKIKDKLARTVYVWTFRKLALFSLDMCGCGELASELARTWQCDVPYRPR